MLELCAAERLLDPSNLQNVPEDVDWSFAIDVEGVVHEFNMTNDCENGDHSTS